MASNGAWTLDEQRRRKQNRGKPGEPLRSPQNLTAAGMQMRRGNNKSLIGSAALLAAGAVRRAVGTESWQAQCWSFYDATGELRDAVAYKANSVSQIKLLAAKRNPETGEPEPQPDSLAQDLLDQFGGGPDSTPELLSRLTLHLEVVGDSYLVGQDVKDAQGNPVGGQDWVVYSTDEVTSSGSRWMVDIGDGDPQPLPDDALVIRVWRPHPRKSWLADSPTRGILTILSILAGLTARMQAEIDSRLAGAGILLLPEEITFTSTTENGESEDGDFGAELIEVMATALKDRSSAAALVPIVLKAAGQYLSDIKHITFSTPIDEKLKESMDVALRRMAMGLSLPQEIMLGLGQTNHWSATQIDEQGTRLHVKPVGNLIASAVCSGYLRPCLLDNGVDDAALWTIIADTTPLAPQTKDTDAALAANAVGAIGLTGLRNLLDIDESNGETDDELVRRVLISAAIASPPDAVAILKALGLNVPEGLPEIGLAGIEEHDRLNAQATAAEPAAPTSGTPVTPIKPTTAPRAVPSINSGALAPAGGRGPGG